MVYNELNNWLNNKPQHGDVAYLIEPITDKRYIYVYRGPDSEPYSHLISDQFAADWFMKEVDKLKVEEPKMEKRCDNCKYFKNMPGSLSWCSHKDHAVLYRSQFKHDEDFENILRFLKLPETYDIIRLPVIESYGGQ